MRWQRRGSSAYGLSQRGKMFCSRWRKARLLPMFFLCTALCTLLLLGMFCTLTQHAGSPIATYVLSQPSLPLALSAASTGASTASPTSKLLMAGEKNAFSSSLSAADSATNSSSAARIKPEAEEAESSQGNEAQERLQPGTRKTASAQAAHTLRENLRHGGRREHGDDAENARSEKQPASAVEGREERVQPSAACPNKRYLFHSFRGGLGNVLFQYFAVSCIAALNNLTLAADNVKALEDLRHPVPSVPRWQLPAPDTPDTLQPAAMGCAFHPSLMTLDPARCHHHRSQGYFQTWRYFQPCLQQAQTRGPTLFKDSVIKMAVSIVAHLRRKLAPLTTLVGVHVRREDYLKPAEKAVGRKTAPPEYFERAMVYFRSHFRDVAFVVLASSPEWFRNHVYAADIFMLPRSASPAVDMEVLARTDHLIISVGTYGWWAAYRNKGTVIAYREFYVPDSVYGRKMNNCTKDFFYPGWILM